jgi:hypothetical protein
MIQKVKSQMTSAVRSIKALPDTFFVTPTDAGDAVTEETPVDPLDSVLQTGTVK